jgi:hypothetical protein
MRSAALATMGLLVAAMAHADESTHVTAEHHVTVCIEGGAGFGVKAHAQAMASQMFAAIGVTIEWEQGQRTCPPQGVLISLTDETPGGFLPGALGYALPYEGAHIRLFYDRIAIGRDPVLAPVVLVHVMVHEITHILQ